MGFADDLSPEECIQELAAIFARGILRSRGSGFFPRGGPASSRRDLHPTRTTSPRRPDIRTLEMTEPA